MKKIAFFVQHLLCGGVEKTLLSLVNELISRGNDVTIYVIEQKGTLLSQIPEGANLIQIPMQKRVRKSLQVGGTKIAVKQRMQEHHFFEAFLLLKNRICNNSEFAELCIDFDAITKLEEGYDIAVNYHMHSPFLVRYLAEKVVAEKKFTWIHNDFSTTKYNIRKLAPYLSCCSLFFCVAQTLVSEYTAIFPEYRDCTYLAHNLIPVAEIKMKAEEFFPDEYKACDTGELILLTVGRVEAQKGYDIALEVCKKLVENGRKFRWFVLGDGTERKRLEGWARQNGLENVFVFCGIKINPYPYFKNCDIYVQTSRHEGYVTTVTEAKLFYKPIVCTDVSGAREQIQDGYSGDICDIDAVGIFEKLDRLMMESERRKSYRDALSRVKENADEEWLNYFN